MHAKNGLHSNSARWFESPLWFRDCEFFCCRRLPGWDPSLAAASRDNNTPLVPKASFSIRQLFTEQRPESTGPWTGSPALKPELPACRLFQGQIQIVSQFLEAHLTESNGLAMQQGKSAEEHKAQH